GLFPSLALAYDIAREDFLKDSKLSTLKVRAGYGIAGNQNIPNFAYRSLYRPTFTNGSVTYVSDGRLGKTDFKLVTGINKLGINFKDKSSYDDLAADTMYLPVGKSIKLNIHAQDVIHSVYMPHFRVQLNAVPGLPTYFKFTPTITTREMQRKENNPKFEYLVYCNKICGGSHYNMKKIVRVVSEAEYQAWLAQQKPYLTDKLKQKLHFADAPAADSTKKVQGNRLALNN
ncbi:MAG: hypothetical protein EOP54_22515, partial [Sphingobacteriales bacterium]